jgi:hypothetical protein
MMKPPSNSQPKNEPFTAVPHAVYQALLVANLNARVLRLAQLIIRLSFGCQQGWADVRQADLTVIGVTSSHAGDVIKEALLLGVVERNGTTGHYRVSPSFIAEAARANTARVEELGQLIRRQLSHSGRSQTTKTVVRSLPEVEVQHYQNGKPYYLPKREDLGLEHSSDEPPKDNQNKSITSVNQDAGLDPYKFAPTNRHEEAAFRVWGRLEQSRPGAFSGYLLLAQRGLGADQFDRLAGEVLEDETIKNKGAVFVTKANTYLLRDKRSFPA